MPWFTSAASRAACYPSCWGRRFPFRTGFFGLPLTFSPVGRRHVFGERTREPIARL